MNWLLGVILRRHSPWRAVVRGCFREEAEMFVRIESGTSCLIWEVTNKELLLVLREVSANVAHVCLDPLLGQR